MATEIERKFLVVGESWRAETMSHTQMIQAYLFSAPDRSMRVRIENDSRATLCIKFGASPLFRDEFEYPIPVADAKELVVHASGAVIEKTRYLSHFQGYLWEIDVYGGVYAGLIVAEVEMDSTDDNPPLPAWVGLEVTHDRRYSNAMLATRNMAGELGHGPAI